jgi:DNA replication protein DnaC
MSESLHHYGRLPELLSMLRDWHGSSRGTGARYCRCHTRGAQAKLLSSARIPRRYASARLSNYHSADINSTQLHAFSYAYRLVHEYTAIDRGLFLMSPCGVRKTHLAAAIILVLIEKKVPCMF